MFIKIYVKPYFYKKGIIFEEKKIEHLAQKKNNFFLNLLIIFKFWDLKFRIIFIKISSFYKSKFCKNPFSKLATIFIKKKTKFKMFSIPYLKNLYIFLKEEINIKI